MMLRRRLIGFTVTLVLGLALAACGSQEETRPLPTEGTIDMNDGSPAPVESPPVTPSAVPDGVDPDDVPIDDDTRQRLERIALQEVGGGEVDDVERSDDVTHAYEVEIEYRGEDYTVLFSEDLGVIGVED